MAVRRTTVVAHEEDLATIAHEAQSRGLSLGRMLGEVVAEHAQELRRDRRPRLATFHSDVGIAEAMQEEKPQARPFRAA